MECWFWNIDRSSADYFWNELQKGRLRQGWGYDPRLDLRKISTKNNSNKDLDDEEVTAWDRCSNMLDYVVKGDLVVVKNVPSGDKFAIVRVVGPYNFAIDKKLSDFGHILPVSKPRVFHKNARPVPTPLVNALNREQNPVRITYKHHDAVVALATNTLEGDGIVPEAFKEKVNGWRLELLGRLSGLLRDTLSPKETEKLIQELLRREGMEFAWTAGPAEQGADFVASISTRYAPSLRVAVQVKMHWGTDDDTTGVDQLEQAFSAHGVQAGLLITTADELGDNLRRRIAQAQRRHHIDVLFGEGLHSRILELIADPEHRYEVRTDDDVA